MKYKDIVCYGGLAVALAAGWAGFQAVVQATGGDAGYRLLRNYTVTPPPEQPVPFSHARHAGELRLPCATCHVSADPQGWEDPRTKGGRHMMLPDTEICMNCHQGVAAESPAIQRLAEYRRMDKAVSWKRVYQVLEGVNWSHRPHLEADIECQTCHGPVEKMEVMSMQTAVTGMSTCLSCHRAHDAGSQCQTCHVWPADEDFRRWKE